MQSSPVGRSGAHLLARDVATVDVLTSGRPELGLNLSPNEALDTPFLLIGTVGEIAAQLRERRDRSGFSYITVRGPGMVTLAPVIEQLRQPASRRASCCPSAGTGPRSG